MDDSAGLTRIAALSGLFSVAFGAFAAHGMANHLEAQSLLKTGAQYEAIHALAALAALAILKTPRGRILTAWLFLLGSVLFCGSLYALALGAPRITGAITPVGGLLFMAGWASFALNAGRAGGQH
ncbi:MAG: DUF423 domain-containing protein [Alphaproteobacteria bacterium]|nr:DUF423 domain-containing protein [Alphaproteobacteria bacterium]